jgi:molecular chaperone GrpE (heat shock protein)
LLNFLIGLEERVLKPMQNDASKEVKPYLVGIEIEKDNLWRSLEGEGVKEIEIKVGVDQ